MKYIYRLISTYEAFHPIRFWGALVIITVAIVLILWKLIKRKNGKYLTIKRDVAILSTLIVEKMRINSHSIPEKEAKKENEHPESYKPNLDPSKIREANPIEKSNSIYKLKLQQSTILEETKVKTEKPKEKLPNAIPEPKTSIKGNLFVNYDSNLKKSENRYPIFRAPEKGCIVRTHRLGSTKRRGFKEDSFQTAIEKFFASEFTISGNVRLNTGKNTRPYEPDIAIMDFKSGQNIRIDIEIDEPYASITRQPTHCKGEDFMRDSYFIDRGWIVLRFSEYQVHTQLNQCLKFIAKIINSINTNYKIHLDLQKVSEIEFEDLWDIVQAQKWEKAKYREQYLNHTFQETNEQEETLGRDFNEHEIAEEKLVKHSPIGEVNKGKNIGFNNLNTHPRDKRIEFYPKPHIYTIDKVAAPSASTIVSKFFPEFDSYLRASNLNVNHEFFGLPVDQIVKIWDDKGREAAQKGTHLHEQIENYYLGEKYSLTGEFHLFEQFVNDHSKLIPYRSEWRIFDDKYHIAGTIDLVVKNGNSFDIYDWKRSKKVINTLDGSPIKFDGWGKCGIGQLNTIHDTSYNRYCLQQSLYRYILEENYGINIGNMYLVVLYPDYNKYYKTEVPYQKSEIEYILKTV